MSVIREKIAVTFLDQESAETVGWPLQYAAIQLGVWQGKTEEELYPLFDRWLNRNTYDLCAVWEKGKKTYRIFRRGFTISNQIDTAMVVTASCGHTEVDFRKVLEHVKFRQRGVSESDIWRTFCYNMRKNWLPTDVILLIDMDNSLQLLPFKVIL